ncbi:restriction endonuclease [Vibrio cholerae]|uniref:ABC-three component system protein n=1 Tax=Vibrio cholerae TaxID=666 RepID=UPI00115874BB|nr:ABC-three component system protein [Vibrio cholerae]TQQ45304.1 restriction endonuclease [Vibrio cholerae]HAS3626200.1 restriction endonuclease [Vibrio cholerae]
MEVHELEIEDVDLSALQLTAINFQTGTPVSPLDRMRIMDDGTWEDFTLELVSYWKTQYDKVVRCGGGGDLGRDIIAYSGDEWENFQCKHYGKKLSVADAILEIGKVLFYSYRGDYSWPRKFYFVSPEGNSNDLMKMLRSPENIKKELLERWDTTCKKKITKTQEVPLESEFKDYVLNTDFEIFDDIPPMMLLDLHSKTRFYDFRFGHTTRVRPRVPKAPTTVEAHEKLYLHELLDAFSEVSGKQINLSNVTDDFDYNSEFRSARNNYFSADALEKFSRDWLPNGFEDLKDECYEAISPTFRQKHSDGYEKYLKTSEAAVNINYTSHPLVHYIKTQDKKGLCHHLVNDQIIRWVKK